ncbi:MAG: M6 family metalloprotease domain-containing protein [Prevotella sp.]|nr:M6 family metalloprotease domain-containing protein [Prevotella sp.]
MRKALFTIAVAAIAAISAWAAPALPGARQVIQADGTTLTVSLHGDEHHHWLAAADGTLLVNSRGAYYVAEIGDDGALLATRLLAHEPALRSADELKAIRRQADRRLLFERKTKQEADAARRAAMIADNAGYLPHTGSPRVLVILTAYKDLPFTVNEPVRAFEQYLNGDVQQNLGNENARNINSVRKYFEQCSHGKFAPQFDVRGPVTLPDSMAYYGAGGERLGQMCRDALALVKDQVNMHDYDNDGDGRAELVYMIFTGVGENQNGPAENLWAKVSTQNINLGDTMRLTRVGCGSEKFHLQRPDWINGIGVFVHEFSHSMGLPDLYPTTTPGRKVNNQSMEYWDVMDNGIYNSNGYAPAAYTAWEQEAMGWQEIETLEQSQTGISMLPTTEEGGRAYKICNAQNDNEFIVVENIQKRGIGAGALGHGLLAYHVAYPKSSVNMGDSPNNTAGRPAVAVIPADSVLISGYLYSDGLYTQDQVRASSAADPFPGTTGQTQLNDGMRLPNFLFYNTDNTLVGASLSNITEDAATGVVTFDFEKQSIPDGISETSSDEPKRPTTTAVYDLGGRIATGARGGSQQKRIVIVGGKKAVMSDK